MRRLLLICVLAGCTEAVLRSPDPEVDTDVPPPEDISPPIAICGALPAAAVPLEPVELVGENSYDPDGIELIDHRWTLESTPEGSAASLPRVDGDSPNREGFVPDMSGTYTATLLVTNERGNRSTTCATSFDAIPTQGIWVELYWTYPGDNLDLHLLRDVAQPTRDDDCWIANCADGLDWGVPGDDADDPVLAKDDVSERGPEAGGIRAPANGNYVIAVSDDDTLELVSDNEATIIIWVNGQKAWTGTHVFTEDNTDKKRIARIRWPSGEVSSLL